MARQKGIIKLQGKIDDISFYKSQDGHLARAKGGVDGERIKNDPAFARTRENGAEFGAAASASKLLRDTIRPMMQNASDNRVTSRLTKVMTDIKNLDTTNLRGKRNVAQGFTTPAGKALLKGFNFNNTAILGSILFKPYAVNPLTGVVNIGNLVPINDIKAPTGATHFLMDAAWAKMDFANGKADVSYSPPQNLPLDATASNITLTPASVPAGPANSINVFLLVIEFFQEINGVQYPLKTGAYNALTVLAVA
jgi:hypothetical protein